MYSYWVFLTNEQIRKTKLCRLCQEFKLPKENNQLRLFRNGLPMTYYAIFSMALICWQSWMQMNNAIVGILVPFTFLSWTQHANRRRTQCNSNTTPMAKWHHHMMMIHWVCAIQTLQFADKIQKRFTELERNTNEFQHSNATPLAIKQFCVNTSHCLMNMSKKGSTPGECEKNPADFIDVMVHFLTRKWVVFTSCEQTGA